MRWITALFAVCWLGLVIGALRQGDTPDTQTLLPTTTTSRQAHIVSHGEISVNLLR